MHVFRSRIIDAPVDRVWASIRAFDGVAEWNPGVEAAVMTSGDATSVGGVRHLTIPGGDFVETLLAHSDLETFYTYRIDESPLPVTGYVATHRLRPVTGGEATYSSWEAWFDCAAEVADEMATLVGDAIFVNGMAGLAAHVDG